jgi:hypothetical protein
MGCCGQKRAALTNAAAKPLSRSEALSLRPSTITGPTPSAIRSAIPSQPAVRDQNGSDGSQPAAPQPGGLYLRYREKSRIVVIGAHTAQQYEFSAMTPVLRVDSRDAVPLLSSGFFDKII